MGFHVAYVAGGELDKVKKVDYVDRIKNFAYLSKPYNKMVMINVPAIEGVYNLEYETPDESVELLSIVATCSGYGENDYYNIFVNDELWFDTWFPTEVKEGLYMGTSTYVAELPPKTKITMKFVNISGTSKKVWMGVRMLRGNAVLDEDNEVEMLDVYQVAEPAGPITNKELLPIPDA